MQIETAALITYSIAWVTPDILASHDMPYRKFAMSKFLRYIFQPLNIKNQMYSPQQVALFFVKKGIEEGKPLTQMKLHKVLFLAHGILMATKDGQKLLDENFQAWEFGPVIPSLYHTYKYYGATYITTLDHLNPDVYQMEFDKNTLEVLESTWKGTKDMDALKLSAWSHKANSPWEKAYRPNQKNIIIPDGAIMDFFIEEISRKSNNK